MHAGSWILQDWWNFIFVFAPLVFSDILHRSIGDMAVAFECFRSAMVFYMRGGSMVSDRATFDRLRAKANTDMWTYAKIVEEKAPPGLMTVNLRFLVVHLPRCASLVRTLEYMLYIYLYVSFAWSLKSNVLITMCVCARAWCVIIFHGQARD